MPDTTRLRDILSRAGFRGRGLRTALAIVMAESGGRAQAHNSNPDTGDNSYGLFQINMLGAMGPERRKQYGLTSNDDLLDPNVNARVAFKMSKGGKNWSPWSTYKSGAYRKFLGNDTYTQADVSRPQSDATPPADKIDRRELAAQYGYAMSVLKSAPELAGLFDQAVKETWTPERFVAEVRGTRWFRDNSEAMRNYLVLKKSDPRTFRMRLNQTRASVRDMAVTMGAQLSDKMLTRISDNVLRFGWSDAQIRDTLAGAVRQGAQDTWGGEAAANVENLRQTARANGIRLGDDTLQQWAVRLAAGEPISGFEQYVRGMAANAFPAWADRIKAGENVEDIADPYRQQMAQTLEINPRQIDLFDPTLRQALQPPQKDGQVVAKPLWQFERELMQDPRFDKTDQARTKAAQFATTIAKTFGAI